jgi:hypothetical protein
MTREVIANWHNLSFEPKQKHDDPGFLLSRKSGTVASKARRMLEEGKTLISANPRLGLC